MLVSHDEARAIDSISRSHRERLVAAGLYPQPVRVSAGRIAFVREEVERWAAERIKARDERRPFSEDPIIRGTAGRRGLPRSLTGNAS